MLHPRHQWLTVHAHSCKEDHNLQLASAAPIPTVTTEALSHAYIQAPRCFKLSLPIGYTEITFHILIQVTVV